MQLLYDPRDDAYHVRLGSQILYWLDDVGALPLDKTSHLFSGGVTGTPDRVVAFVRAMSEALTVAGVEHTFEVCDKDGELLHVFPC